MILGSTSEDIKCIPVFALMELSNEGGYFLKYYSYKDNNLWVKTRRNVILKEENLILQSN